MPEPGPRPAAPPLPKLSATWGALRADTTLQGRSWSKAAQAATDLWLQEALARAVGEADGRPVERKQGGLLGGRLGRRGSPGGPSDGLALLAVGSLGRGDLAPGSDLDLLLVHDGRPDVVEVADRLWYPIWDDPMPLDHSVRTLSQVQTAAESDLRVAQGLLDGRAVAGDPDLGAKTVALGRRLWEKRVAKWLPEVLEARAAAWAAHGDVAFMLEPELQEGRGGLRDLQLLALMAMVTPVVAAVVADDRLGPAAEMLQAVRVELQRGGGQRSERLMLDDLERVAQALGLDGREALAHDVAQAGRTVAWLTEDACRRAQSWLSGPGGRGGSADRPLGPGLVLRDNEVAVPVSTSPQTDPTLALRAAAASARLGVPMARQTMARLAAEPAEVPSPWGDELTRAFLDLLSTGGPGIHAIETLDQIGLWELYLPEWPQVRNRPQFNPYHRWSVDRHLLEAVANAAANLRAVARPDLLLLGALFHDIGKGQGGDHSETGAAIAARAVARIGLSYEDAVTLEKVVRHHLLVPEIATRRDIDDPATIALVAEAVEDETTLEVLGALATADGTATGAAAWTDWKAGLVAELVRRTASVLAGRPTPAAAPFPSAEHRLLMSQGGVQVRPEGRRLVVVAPDRPGLFSDVAGALALHDIGVLEARAHSEDGTALEVLALDLAAPAQPRWERIVKDVEGAAGGALNVAEALARRPPPRSQRRNAGLPTPGVRVLLDNRATGATIVEVRAPDGPGILYRITAALVQHDLDIVSARVATLGSAVVDTFYVRLDGGKVPVGRPSEQLRASLEASVSAQLGPSAPSPHS